MAEVKTCAYEKKNQQQPRKRKRTRFYASFGRESSRDTKDRRCRAEAFQDAQSGIQTSAQGFQAGQKGCQTRSQGSRSRSGIGCSKTGRRPKAAPACEIEHAFITGAASETGSRQKAAQPVGHP